MGSEAAATAGENQPHVLFVPYPAQGHINPAVQLAKCLASKGLKVTVLTTTSVRKLATLSSPWDSITIDDISDGSEEVKEVETIDLYFKRFRDVLSKNLKEYIDKFVGSLKAIIYDSTMPWVLDIAHEKGLRGAVLFTMNCTVCAVYYNMKRGCLKYPYEDPVVSLPSLPDLGIKDLPYWDMFPDPNHTIVRLLEDQFSNLEKTDWILFNTFYKLECEIVDWMTSRWPIKTVGPTCSLLQTDEKLANNNNNHMISLFEPKQEACAEWLDSKGTNSVIYISFGSVATLGKEQMQEIARGLLMSDCYFLWVVRASEKDKLPESFASTASEKGLIMEWCHQPQVLAHNALAGFMTHCGWNSTLEALSNGVPLIAMGQWVDQTTNSKLIEDVWKFGIRAKVGDIGIVTRDEIAKCIQEISEGDKGKELKRNAKKWKELAKEAVENGGTSANNIEDFVSEIICS